MNKKQMVEAIHDRVGLPKRDVAEIIDRALGLIKASLMDNQDVSISRIGKFHIRQTKARVGRNPQTGERIDLPSRKTVAFKASRILKGQVDAAHRKRDTQ